MAPALRRSNNAERIFARAVFLLLLLFVGASVTHASHASGTIDPAHKYAWGTVASWINFAPTNGGLTVTDSALTGYAWAANTGWINFNPANGGVTNTTAGTLGGFAWDSGGGWVSFTGVTIDSNGLFHGTATGNTVNGATYTINFDCTNCDVRTDWRPTASAASTASSDAPSGGSIGLFANNPSPLQTQNTNSANTPTESNKSLSASSASGSAAAGSTYLPGNTFFKKSPAGASTTATKSFSTKILSVIRAAVVPASIFSLLILALLFLF